MYDGVTSRYTFACPKQGELSLSLFRTLEPLAGTGTVHPVVYSLIEY